MTLLHHTTAHEIGTAATCSAPFDLGVDLATWIAGRLDLVGAASPGRRTVMAVDVIDPTLLDDPHAPAARLCPLPVSLDLDEIVAAAAASVWLDGQAVDGFDAFAVSEVCWQREHDVERGEHARRLVHVIDVAIGSARCRAVVPAVDLSDVSAA